MFIDVHSPGWQNSTGVQILIFIGSPCPSTHQLSYFRSVKDSFQSLVILSSIWDYRTNSMSKPLSNPKIVPQNTWTWETGNKPLEILQRKWPLWPQAHDPRKPENNLLPISIFQNGVIKQNFYLLLFYIIHKNLIYKLNASSAGKSPNYFSLYKLQKTYVII